MYLSSEAARDAPIEYFENRELDALFKSIDRSSLYGTRDYVLFALLFNTSARVQEIITDRRGPRGGWVGTRDPGPLKSALKAASSQRRTQ
jgi:hypothetical protein